MSHLDYKEYFLMFIHSPSRFQLELRVSSMKLTGIGCTIACSIRGTSTIVFGGS